MVGSIVLEEQPSAANSVAMQLAARTGSAGSLVVFTVYTGALDRDGLRIAG